MKKQENNTHDQKPYVKIWACRSRLLPAALLVLIIISTLSIMFRIQVLEAEPHVDMTPFLQLCETADRLSAMITSRTKQRMPAYDLSLLNVTVKPAAVGSSRPTSTMDPVSARKPAAAQAPLPSLEGIIYSETERSLAVLENKTAAEGDVVAGWRLMKINPERVTMVHEDTGMEEVIELYENSTDK